MSTKKRSHSAERKKLVKELDKVFGKIVILLDRKRCVVCGKTENLQCGHLFSRVAYSTRWDFMNAFCQCRGCNYRHEHDPTPLTLYFINTFGKRAYEQLYRKYRTPIKYSNEDLKIRLNILKGVLKRYETDGYKALPRRVETT